MKQAEQVNTNQDIKKLVELHQYQEQPRIKNYYDSKSARQVDHGRRHVRLTAVDSNGRGDKIFIENQ